MLDDVEMIGCRVGWDYCTNCTASAWLNGGLQHERVMLLVNRSLASEIKPRGLHAIRLDSVAPSPIIRATRCVTCDGGDISDVTVTTTLANAYFIKTIFVESINKIPIQVWHH